MMSSTKKALLTILSFTLIVSFFGLPANNDWIKLKVLKPISDIEEQLIHMEPEERMAFRYSNAYVSSRAAIDVIAKRVSYNADTLKNLLFLLPPKAYMKKNKVSYSVPEPVVFYYLTGYKALWANQKGAEKCNYAFVAAGQNIAIRRLDSTSRSLLLKEFRTYKISL